MSASEQDAGNLKDHRGRWQAQGGGTEQSVKWEWERPPTKQEMLRMLDRLWDKLTTSEQQLREPCFKQADAFFKAMDAEDYASRLEYQAPINPALKN